jgi:hypothetical protein
MPTAEGRESDDDRAEEIASPACGQEVGYRSHPKKCSRPARFALVDADGTGNPIWFCEDHAYICMDATGARISLVWNGYSADPARQPGSNSRNR